MMGPMDDLPTLVGKKDHLGVLRYVRAHQLREPKLVVEHGQLLMGKDLSKSLGVGVSTEIKYAVLEQICLAALDAGDDELAELCLTRLKQDKEVVDPTSTRFRCLLARCLEASEDYDEAQKIYDNFLTFFSKVFCFVSGAPACSSSKEIVKERTKREEYIINGNEVRPGSAFTTLH